MTYPRMIGTVRFVNPERGFGLLKVPGHRNHHFTLADAPQDIAPFAMVRFTSHPASEGQKLPSAKDLEIVTDAILAA